MPRDRDEPAAVRVYTVCDESRYLIVRNVPSLGCGDDLASLFGTYGPVEECTPMDAEDSEPYTDVFFVKFSQVNNARFAKRKLDESVFLGNRLQVTYAPQFESPQDTKEKLEVRRKEVLGRIKSSAGRPEGSSPAQGSSSGNHHQMNSNKREYMKTIHASPIEDPRFSHVSSDKDYFPSESMNATVKLVRGKLDKIQSGGDNSSTSAASRKPGVDKRRRI
ncbi:nucleic acid binding protein [Zea mays]|uniref:RNA-binding protein 48 n=2 Tax=Zea mays TaxID=4577 RepID=B6SH26_MAIZE|nr:nucleic acid binding protein [Zea mays]ACG24159.1 nucleic acid binding protein [Zea mays]AQK61226.1 Nucleic acid binding protein [Zea mays]|eukprot:NP_001146882.1 nucleic acid binding protein [Zea mays]